MAEFSYQYLSNSNAPEKWVFFLHGYNNTQCEMEHVYKGLLGKTENLAIIAPVGKQTSSMDSNRHSWWKVSGFDTDGKRLKTETPVEEIADIYNQVGSILYLTANEVNDFIDSIQQKYNFTDNQTYVAGFSQGAMLGIWTSLIRKNQVKGCFSCSGLVVANSYLNDKINSKPKVYLLHGKQDKQVLYKCHEYSIKTLEKLGLDTTAITYEHLTHEVSNEEIEFIASKLK